MFSELKSNNFHFQKQCGFKKHFNNSTFNNRILRKTITENNNYKTLMHFLNTEFIRTRASNYYTKERYCQLNKLDI